MSPFATNDVVRLKSGGPNMLVLNCADDGVHCVWTWQPPGEPHPRLQTQAFHSDTLELVASRSYAEAP